MAEFRCHLAPSCIECLTAATREPVVAWVLVANRERRYKHDKNSSIIYDHTNGIVMLKA